MASDTEDDELASLRAAALKSIKPKAQPIQQVISVSGQGVVQQKRWNEFPASADVSQFQFHPEPLPVPAGFSQGVVQSLPRQPPPLTLQQGFQRLPSSPWHHQPFGNGMTGQRHFQPRGQDNGRPYARAPRRSFGDRGRPPLDRGGRFSRRGYLPEQRGGRGFYQRPAPSILGVPNVADKDLAGGNLIVINPRPSDQPQQAPLSVVQSSRLPALDVNNGAATAGGAKPKLELPQDKYHNSTNQAPTNQVAEDLESTSKTRDKFSRYDRDSDEEDEDEEEQHSDTEDITSEIDKFLNDSGETVVLDEEAVPDVKDSSVRRTSISEEVPEIDISDVKDHIDCKDEEGVKEDGSDAESVDLDALASGDLEDVLNDGLDKVEDSADNDNLAKESESLDKLLDSGIKKSAVVSQSPSSSSSSSLSDSSGSSSEDEKEDKTECLNISKSKSLNKTKLGNKVTLKASSPVTFLDPPSSPPPDSPQRSKSPQPQRGSLSSSPGKDDVNHEQSRSPSLERTYALETTFSPKKERLSSESPPAALRSRKQLSASPAPTSSSTHRPLSRSPKHCPPRSPHISSPPTGSNSYSSRSPLHRQKSRSPRGPARRRSISPRGPDRQRLISPRRQERQRSISPREPGRQRSVSPRGKERPLSPRESRRERPLSPRESRRERPVSPRESRRQRSISSRRLGRRRSISPRVRERPLSPRGARRQRSISPRGPERRRSVSPPVSPRRQRPISPPQSSRSPSKAKGQGLSPLSGPLVSGSFSPNRQKNNKRRSTSPRGSSVPYRRGYSPQHRSASRRSRSPTGPERERRRERATGEGRQRRSSSHSRERHKEPLKVQPVRSPKRGERDGKRKAGSVAGEPALSKNDLEKLTPEEREKLEARRKKFSNKEITIDPGKKVSLKSIKERSKKKKLREQDAADLNLEEPAIKVKKYPKSSKTERGTNSQGNNEKELTLSDLEDDSGDSDSGRAWKRASAQDLSNSGGQLTNFGKMDSRAELLRSRRARENTHKTVGGSKGLYNRPSKRPDTRQRPDLISDDESGEDEGLTSSRLTSSIVKAQPYKANIPLAKLKIEVQVSPKKEKKQKAKPNFSTVYSVPAKRQFVEGDDEEEGEPAPAPVKAKHKKRKHQSESPKLFDAEDAGIEEPVMPARPSIMDRLGKKVDLPPVEKKEKKKKKRKHADEEREAPVTELDVKIQRIKEQNAAIARRTLEIEQDKKRYG